jgi:hypothetical protein
MMLESSLTPRNSFLTLTYRDEDLPDEFVDKKTGELYARNSVNPSHIKAFTNNLQTSYKRDTGYNLRYFLCGEYGDKTNRPHYHLALFGYPNCLLPNRNFVVGRKFVPCVCPNCIYLAKKWPYGHIFLGNLEQQSAQYVAGYVTKKMHTNTCGCKGEYHHEKCAHSKLQGRYPEFSRQSLKPGLGHDAIVKHAISKKSYIHKVDDIPKFLIHDQKKWPIGKYLFNVYKETLGFENEPVTKAHQARERHDTVLAMFKDKTLSGYQKDLIYKGLPESALRLLNAQRVLQIEKREEFKVLNKQGV